MDAKEKMVRYCVRLIRDHGLEYDAVQECFQRIRKEARLKRPRRGRRLPQLLTEAEIEGYFDVVARRGTPGWELLYRVMLATAVRISELIHIQHRHINFDNCTIFIAAGKGDVDRYVPFPEELALPIRQQMATTSRYLFEAAPGKPWAVRTVQTRMDRYAVAAGIVDEDGRSRIYPHLFRHQTATYWVQKGVPITDVANWLGHRSINTTMIYTHLALNVERYQAIMAGR